MIDKGIFGKRLSILRKRAGFSQATFAEKFGVSTQAVSKWETGLALPDVELLLEISYLFDISLNSLLEGDDTFSNPTAITTNLPEKLDNIMTLKKDRQLISALMPYFTESEICDIGIKIKNRTLNINLSAEVSDTKTEYHRAVSIPIKHLSGNVLRELAPAISESMGELVGGIDRGLKRISEFMICPACKGKLELVSENSGKSVFFICAQGHRYNVDEGVVYFNTREVPGELWSLYLRNYEHYLLEQNHPGLPIYQRGGVYSQEVKWREIEKLHPRIILDVACGTGSGIKYVLQRINWNCTVILCDLSHRILKWNRRFFSETIKNPYVDLVYFACDCANIPLTDNSIDCVTSRAGFESMQEKMMDGFCEGYRILKNNTTAVYDISVVDDLNSYNTQKWIELLHTIPDNEDGAIFEKMIEIGTWKEKCKGIGYKNTDPIKIYGELPAPDVDTFPFENMIMRWMAEYICVSRK